MFSFSHGRQMDKEWFILPGIDIIRENALKLQGESFYNSRYLIDSSVDLTISLSFFSRQQKGQELFSALGICFFAIFYLFQDRNDPMYQFMFFGIVNTESSENCVKFQMWEPSTSSKKFRPKIMLH